MLRYLASGPRNFTTSPVPLFERMNWEFYAVLRGCAAPFFREGETPELRVRTLWLLPPRIRYGWKGDGKSCYRAAFHFSKIPLEIEQAMGKQNFLSVRLGDKEGEEIKSMAKSLLPHYRKPHQFSALHCERVLLSLSLMIARDLTPRTTLPLHQRDEVKLERAIAWYSVHLSSNPTVDQVAAAVHMSGTNFRIICRKVRGMSPHKILREIQMKRACEVLANTTSTLDQVAPQCGFQSVESFCRVFRKEMGVTADVWRRYT